VVKKLKPGKLEPHLFIGPLAWAISNSPCTGVNHANQRFQEGEYNLREGPYQLLGQGCCQAFRFLVACVGWEMGKGGVTAQQLIPVSSVTSSALK